MPSFQQHCITRNKVNKTLKWNKNSENNYMAQREAAAKSEHYLWNVVLQYTGGCTVHSTVTSTRYSTVHCENPGYTNRAHPYFHEIHQQDFSITSHSTRTTTQQHINMIVTLTFWFEFLELGKNWWKTDDRSDEVNEGSLWEIFLCIQTGWNTTVYDSIRYDSTV